MIKNIVISLLLISSIFSKAQEVKFHKNIPWKDVVEMAEKENKFIFVDTYTDWCYWCKVMDKKTFTDESVVNLLNEKFIAVKIDAEKDEGIEIAAKFRIAAYPTVLFLDPKGMLVKKHPGYLDVEKFIKTSKEVLDNDERLTFDGKKLNPGFPKFYVNSFDPEKRKEKASTEEIEKYLSGRSDLTDEVSWAIISRYSLSEKYLNWFLNKKDVYAKMYGKGDVNDKIRKIGNYKLNSAIKNKSDGELKQALQFVEKYFEDEYKIETIDYYKISYYKGIGDWIKFVGLVDPTINETNPNQINSYCWDIFENCDDEKVIKFACEWMKIAVEKSPEWALLDTYAAVLYKAKNYDEAEKWANEAIKTGKEAGEKVEDTEKLLEKIKSGK